LSSTGLIAGFLEPAQLVGRFGPTGYDGSAVVGQTVTLPGNLMIGSTYTITSIGTTDFTLVGATSNTLGLTFTANGAGTGTGLNASGTGAPSGTAQTARTAGQWLGEETHLLTTAELASHTHSNTVGSSAGGSNSVTGYMNSNSAHTHDIRMRADNSVVNGNYILAASGSSVTYNNSSTSGTNGGGAGNGDGKTVSTNTDHTHAIGINNVAAGGGSRHDIIPPVLVMNFIIKT
jgi:microcystin-dependent protein